jgi:hypothetical protein
MVWGRNKVGNKTALKAALNGFANTTMENRVGNFWQKSLL